MKQIPQTIVERLIEAGKLSPAIIYSDGLQDYIGLVYFFVIDDKKIKIKFKWIIIGQKLFLDHIAIFKEPEILCSEDIFTIKHAGNYDVTITNLASFKINAMNRRNKHEKQNRH